MTSDSESTATLLQHVRAGDLTARERLVARYLPMLRAWARGRLPHSARDLNDTQDLVQITLISALQQIDQFEAKHEGAFLAYLRTCLMNSIRMEIRRVGRRGVGEELDELALPGSELSKRLGIEAAIDYERALGKLSPTRRESVILRFEFGMSFAEIAAAMEQPSANAAHMMVSRALLDLARELG
jgi:RNA polymerase sigma factor (sigma-70 family)